MKSVSVSIKSSSSSIRRIRLLILFCVNWQPDGKGTAFTGAAPHGDFAVMRLNNVFDQTQSQSVAVDLRGSGLAASIERLEDARQIFFRDTQTAILERKCYIWWLNGAVYPSLQSDPTTFAAVLHRVAEQVLQRARQCGAVAQHWRQRGLNLLVKLKPTLVQQRLVGLRHFIQQMIEVQRLKVVKLASRLNPGEFQRLIDHLLQLSHLFANDPAVILNLVRIARHAFGEVIRGGVNDRDRRAQFV